jgi:hypothetical protein
MKLNFLKTQVKAKIFVNIKIEKLKLSKSYRGEIGRL